MTDSIIKLENVSSVYEGEKRPAISDMNLILERKVLAFVVGPNASEKTTLLETINGLLPLFRGEISVLSFNVITQESLVRREIGYVPQDFIVEPMEPYSALDVVLMGRYGRIGLIHRSTEKDRDKATPKPHCARIEDKPGCYLCLSKNCKLSVINSHER